MNNVCNTISIYDTKTNTHCASNLDALYRYIESDILNSMYTAITDTCDEEIEKTVYAQTLLAWLPMVKSIRLNRTDYCCTELEFNNNRTITFVTHMEQDMYAYFFKS